MLTVMTWQRVSAVVLLLAGGASIGACGTTSDPNAGAAGFAGTLAAAAGRGGASAGASGGASGGAAAGGTAGVSAAGGSLGTGNAGAAGGGGAGGSGSGGGSGSTGGAGGSSACSADSEPLKTGQSKVDAYDCAIIAVAAKYGLPDPMIVKAQIQQESNFEIFATSQDSPCGIKNGWSDAESKSFGLIQTTPACGEAKSALLPDGHPNLSQDITSALWKNSVFNPPVNLDEGVKTDAEFRAELVKKYAGCSAAQYNMMSAGAFNSGVDAVLGCAMYNQRAQNYVDAITGHYHGFAAGAHWADPY